MNFKILKKMVVSVIVLIGGLSLLSFKSVNINIPIYIMNQKEPPTVIISQEKEQIEVDKGWVEVSIKEPEDLKKLEELYKAKGDTIQVIVKDYISIIHEKNIAKALDLIDEFYYNIPIKYPNVKKVVVMGDLEKADNKIQNKYSKISIHPYIKVDNQEAIAQEEYVFMMPIPKKEGQYIEYKINEKLVGQVSRAPYVFEVDSKWLHEGINKIRIIIHNEEDKKPKTETFYIEYKEKIVYEDRSLRKQDNYAKENKTVYDFEYIPVLMYHKFLKEVGSEDQSIAVSTELFEQHLQRLLKEGYTPINFKQLDDYLKGINGLPAKPIIITADDGYLCNYEEAYKILEKYKVPATFFVATEHMGSTSYNNHFTWEQAKEMESSGLIDIQSHSHRHKAMNKLTEMEVRYEMNASFALIEKYLGKRDVKVLAYPQFQHTNRVQQWVKNSGVNIQITDLVRKPVKTEAIEVKRIHVSNEMSTDKLIKKIEGVTRK